MFGGNFPPAGWAFCAGQILSIAEYETLFNLIGTTYGGDGQNTFALPDLRGRLPIHQGQGPGLSNFVIGQIGGTETVTLTTQQIPAHSHTPIAQSSAGTVASPANAVWAGSAIGEYAGAVTPSSAMSANLVGSAGGSQPHENRMPFLAVNYIISLFGIFPSQN